MSKIKFLLPILSVTLLSACFDVSGPSDSNIAKERPNYDITGHAVDGLIKNGDVRVYDFATGKKGSILGTGKTDSFGVFDASVKGIKSGGQYVLSCAVSGSYVEEASGVQISLEDGQELCAVKYFDPEANFTVVINPWSHYAYALVTYLTTQGEAVENAATEANTTFSSIAGFNNLTTVPYDTTDISVFGKPYNEAMLMGYSIAGISQFTLDISKDAGLTRHTNNFSSMAFHQINFNDISSDGKWDGKGLAQNGKSIVSLGMGTREFDRYTNNLEIAKATVDFVNSDMNKAGVDVPTLLGDLDDLASSTDGVFGSLTGEPVPTLDGDGPVITTNFANNQFVSGSIEIKGIVDDFSGVRSLKAVINGEEFQMQAKLGEYSFNYITQGDQTLEVSIIATDLLNNTSVKSFDLIAANSKPIPTLISSDLTNNLSYLFQAELRNYPQGVKEITLNGEVISLNSDSIISGNIELVSGLNDLELLITDNTDSVFSYNFEIKADTTNPVMVFEVPNLASNYKTYYKDFAISEPFLSSLVFDKSGNPLYIDSLHTNLGGQSISEANLKDQNWVYFKFSVSDPVNSGNDFIGTPSEELKVSYQYMQGNSVQPERVISAFDEDGNYIVPLSDEFLADDWEKYDATHKLVFFIEDKANNKYSLTREFTTYSSSPEFLADVDTDTWKAGQFDISLDTTDFTGLDRVVLTVDGVDYDATDVINPSFRVNGDLLESGLNYGTVKAYKDGQLLLTSEIEFSIDHTAASVVINSPTYFNNSEYVFTGTATDNESGIDFVSINGSNATYNLFDDSFSKSITGLQEGVHSFTVIGQNNAGLQNVIERDIHIDLSTPKIVNQYPSISNSYLIDYQNNPNSPSSQGELSFENDSTIFYLDKEKISLQDNIPTVNYLKTKRIPFLQFDVLDSFSNGAGTTNSDLVVSFDYSINGVTKKSNSVLNSSNNNYILPITKEFLGADFYGISTDDVNTITVHVTDKAGNSKDLQYYFNAHVVPDTGEITVLESSAIGVDTVSVKSNLNKYAVIKDLYYTNTQPHDLSVVFTGSGDLKFNHEYVLGKKWVSYTAQTKTVYAYWRKDGNKLATYRFNNTTKSTDLYACKLEFSETFYGEGRDVNNNIITRLLPSNITSSNYTGYSDIDTPTSETELEPIPNPYANANPILNSTLFGLSSSNFRNGSYSVNKDNNGVMSMYEWSACVDRDQFEANGTIEFTGPHTGIQATGRPISDSTLWGLQKRVTTYNYTSGSPKNEITSFSKDYDIPLDVKFVVTRANNSEQTYRLGNEIKIANGETVNIKVLVDTPKIVNKGEDCSFNAAGKYCDKGYSWSTNPIYMDTFINSDNKDHHRPLEVFLNTISGNVSKTIN